MPRAERPPPPYVQIADHYRGLILDGELQPGAKLPSVADIAAEWHVSTSTSSKAITHLQVEGAVWTSSQGTFVSGGDVIARAPGERIRGAVPSRAASGAAVEVTAAHIVTAPDYVAGLLGMPTGSQVVRREEITSLRAHPQMLSVDWIPAEDVRLAPDLTNPEPLEQGIEVLIASITGRLVTHSRDHLRGRAAGQREANALRLPVGTPILAGAHVWSDDEGVILYGEWVMPPDQVISYDYEVTAPTGG